MSIKPYLKQLGYASLKPKQVDLINCFIRKEDCIGVLPTGYGKSICYILPYLLKKRNVIVISPLISLMEDQRMKLNEKGINTISFNSANSFDSFDNKLHIKQLKTKEFTGILYFSPESFMTNQTLIKLLLSKKLISLFAIDECHCITSWSDFRSNYAELGIIKDLINESYKVPIMALTATATLDTIDKIKSSLELDIINKSGDENIVKESFAKDKLSISFQRKVSIQIDTNNIIELIKKHKCKTIIYCKTKKETEDISDRLNLGGINAKYYHAGLPTKTRSIVQQEFTTGKIDIITATIAFGMGIDIPTIYLIIHYGISKEIESYYQEIGRAGRDGSESHCYLYWSDADFRLNKYFISLIKDDELKQSQSIKIKQVQDFIYSSDCRMKFMLNYFGEDYDKCGKCDNCLQINKKQILPNNIYIYMILKTFIELDHGIGVTKLINILFGSKSKEMTPDMKRLSMFGIFDTKTSKQDMKTIILQLKDNNLLLIQTSSNSSLSSFYNISPTGREYYKKWKPIILKSNKTLIKFVKLILPKCTKLKHVLSKSVKPAPSKVQSKINHGKQWTHHDNTRLCLYIQQDLDLETISSELGRGKQGIETRIIHNINNNTLISDTLYKCKWMPTSETIKQIKLEHSKLENVTSKKELKTKLNNTCSYFDIDVALSNYGKRF